MKIRNKRETCVETCNYNKDKDTQYPRLSHSRKLTISSQIQQIFNWPGKEKTCIIKEMYLHISCEVHKFCCLTGWS